MQYITTTELRTKSKKLVSTLKKGNSAKLIHRSKVIGEIIPTYEPQPITEDDIKTLQKLAQKLHLPRLSYKEREKRYRKHLMDRYGKDLS